MIEKEPQKSTYQQAVSQNKQHKEDANLSHESIQSLSMQNSKYEMLSGYLDEELTQQEAQKVMLLLESDEDYRQLHDEMLAMRQEVQSLSLQESELEHLDRLFQEPVAKTSRIFGFALLAISAFILVAFTMYAVVINTAINIWLKFAIGFLSAGGLFLLYSVLRQRMMVSKNDKYNRVKM
jgi:hypothetical protein